MEIIAFKVGESRYACNLEWLQRIIAVPDVTPLPNAHPFVEGMIPYEDRVLKVIDLRKMVGLPRYKEELIRHFEQLKTHHEGWVKDLIASLQEGSAFEHATNPHQCHLGKWLDAFSAYDDTLSGVLKQLNHMHKQLHTYGVNALNQKPEARDVEQLKRDIEGIFEQTMALLLEFIRHFATVANAFQKLLIIENGEEIFAMKIDQVIDIASVDVHALSASRGFEQGNDNLELAGVIELEGELMNLIKTIKIPKVR